MEHTFDCNGALAGPILAQPELAIDHMPPKEFEHELSNLLPLTVARVLHTANAHESQNVETKEVGVVPGGGVEPPRY